MLSSDAIRLLRTGYSVRHQSWDGCESLSLHNNRHVSLQEPLLGNADGWEIVMGEIETELAEALVKSQAFISDQDRLLPLYRDEVLNVLLKYGLVRHE